MASQKNYRFYSFTNFYFSSLQKGLQTAHAVSEMSVTMYDNDYQRLAYCDWAEKDKTIIILNGGNHGMLVSLYETVKRFGDKHNLPHTIFFEDEQSANKCCTSVGIVLPSDVYEFAAKLRSNTVECEVVLDYVDTNFFTALNSCGLAN